MDFRGIYTF